MYGRFEHYLECDGVLSEVTEFGNDNKNGEMVVTYYHPYPDNKKIAKIERGWKENWQYRCPCVTKTYDVAGRLTREKRQDKNNKIIYRFPKN